MKKAILILFSTFLLIFSAFGQVDDKKKSLEGKEKSANNNWDEKKKYTREEFRKAVLFEVDKQLTRLGRKKLVELFSELLGKERRHQDQVRILEKKKKEYEVSVKSFEAKIKEFETRQQKFIACMDEAENAKKERVAHMVKVLEGMRPQSAANILSVQESSIAVKLIERLPSDNISKMFNVMDKEISARLQKQYMSMKK